MNDWISVSTAKSQLRTVWAHGATVILGALLTLATTSANAQMSGKVIHLVVPFDAGGAREVLARTFYSELGQALGQTVIVENRPGAGGAIGTASVARSVPDGNTLIFAASSHNITALVSPNAGYDPIRDFVPVANVGMQSYVLMTSSQVPAASVAEFVAYAKAHPGELNYSSPGHGSSGHLAMTYFCKLAADYDPTSKVNAITHIAQAAETRSTPLCASQRPYFGKQGRG